MRHILVFVLVCVAAGISGLRVDNLKGFRYCNTPQVTTVERVDVVGRACSQWPCIMTPGREGTFHITLSQDTEYPINFMKTDIFANARLKVGGRRRIGMQGETNEPACRYTRPGCPFYPHTSVVISKTIQVPTGIRLVKSPLIVEFRITDEYDRILTCFMAPVIVG